MVARTDDSADNGRVPRRAALVLLALAASAPIACRKSGDAEGLRASLERALARSSLASLCEAYTKAEQQVSDPARAYAEVRDHHMTLWPPLHKMRAGVEAVDPVVRYSMWLRFARNDYGVAGWSCPALDRLLLHEIEARAKASPPAPATPPKFRHAMVRVARSGDVSIDGEAVALASVKDAVRRLEERSPPVFMTLYREGWPRDMHPNAASVINDLADQPFSFAVCSRSDCPD
jgi:hypothetical protein